MRVDDDGVEDGQIMVVDWRGKVEGRKESRMSGRLSDGMRVGDGERKERKHFRPN